MKFVWFVFCLLIGGILSACITPQYTTPRPLETVLKSSKVIALPYTESEAGLMYVSVKISGSKDLLFLVDTGATKSSLFEHTRVYLGLEKDPNNNVRIYGMIQSGVQPLVKINSFELGHAVFSDRTFALLENLAKSNMLEIQADGILGMDILSDYRMFRSTVDKTIFLIPNEMPNALLPVHWRVIPLMPNPFVEDARHLKFMDIRFRGASTPALLDTGAEYNMMNWDFASFPQLRKVRKRLEEDWKLQGAIGVFEPATVIKFEHFKAGQKYWGDQIFIVMQFESLDVLGIKDQPFAIAGAPLLKGSDFYMDFKNNSLTFAQEKEHSMRVNTLPILVIHAAEPTS